MKSNQGNANSNDIFFSHNVRKKKSLLVPIDCYGVREEIGRNLCSFIQGQWVVLQLKWVYLSTQHLTLRY